MEMEEGARGEFSSETSRKIECRTPILHKKHKPV